MTKDWGAMVTVGRVARPHGNRGQVVVNPETDFPEERFRPGGVLYRHHDRRIERMTITACRMHRGRPIVGFEGFGTISAAEGLAGVELRVPEDALVPLAPGTFYHHDLIGCAVGTRAGVEVGSVVRVEGTMERALLVVAAPRGEVLVPMVEAICVVIDIHARAIVIDPPEGLLDVNAPTR